MADFRVRAAERQWENTQSRSDEVAYLRELLRSGLFLPSRMRLAAVCGSTAACVVLEVEPFVIMSPIQWTRQLLQWGPIPAATANRLMMALPDTLLADSDYAAICEQFDAWLRDPTEVNLDALRANAQASIRKSGGKRPWHAICLASMALSVPNSNDMQALIIGAAAMIEALPNAPARLASGKEALLAMVLDLESKPLRALVREPLDE